MAEAGECGDQPRHRQRHWWWRCAVALILLPPLVFGLSNCWLNSSFGRAWLAGCLGKFCGMETRLRGANWSPWNGVTLQGLEFAQPPELAAGTDNQLLETSQIRVLPHWRLLTKGMFVPRQIEMDGLHATVPVELLCAMAARHCGELLPAAPTVASAGTPTAPAQPPAAQPLASNVPPDAGSPPPAPIAAKAPQPEVTTWLKIRNASCCLVSAHSGRVWFDLADMSGELPLWGGPAEGKLSIASLTVAGIKIGGGELPVVREGFVLGFGPWRPKTSGGSLELRGQLVPHGSLPFVVECRVPEQPVAAVAVGNAWTVTATRAEAVARIAGQFRIPDSWQGELRAVARGVAVKEQAGETVTFDDAWLVAGGRGSVLQVVDVRAIGEFVSLLGNALIAADGRFAANVRCVASPDLAAVITTRWVGRWIGEGAGFQPLVTPDRLALDVRAGGTLEEPWVELGDGPTWRLATLHQAWEDGVPRN